MLKIIMFGLILVSYSNICFAVDVKQQLPKLLVAAETKHRLPRGILKAIAQVESSNNYRAYVHSDGISKRASYGLLQLQYASAKQVGYKGMPVDLMHPENNIEYGARYLSYIIKKQHGDVSLALVCYNGGMSSKACKHKKYTSYVGKVLNAWTRK